MIRECTLPAEMVKQFKEKLAALPLSGEIHFEAAFAPLESFEEVARRVKTERGAGLPFTSFGAPATGAKKDLFSRLLFGLVMLASLLVAAAFFLALFEGTAHGQSFPPPSILPVTVNPSGACSPAFLTWNSSTGEIYGCKNSVWTAAGSGSLGGVQATDCTSVGFVQKVNTDGTIGCAAGGGTTRTWSYFWEGSVQAGATGFAANLPATGAPVLANSGGTRPMAVLQWPEGQSTYYAWWTFVMPAGYTSNAAISYSLETRSADGTHLSNVYLGLGCSSTVTDNPTIVEAAAVGVTSAASTARTVTAGTLTPNSGGLPACAAGQRVWINLRVDTNVSGNVMTQPLELVGATFSVTGSM